jgi:hypothetical protein
MTKLTSRRTRKIKKTRKNVRKARNLSTEGGLTREVTATIVMTVSTLGGTKGTGTAGGGSGPIRGTRGEMSTGGRRGLATGLLIGTEEGTQGEMIGQITEGALGLILHLKMALQQSEEAPLWQASRLC